MSEQCWFLLSILILLRFIKMLYTIPASLYQPWFNSTRHRNRNSAWDCSSHEQELHFQSCKTLLWLEWEMSPTGSCIWILLPWLVALFGDVMELQGGGGLLEEGCHSGQASRVYSLALHLSSSLLPVWAWNVTSRFLAARPASHSFVISSPPWWTVSQSKPL